MQLTLFQLPIYLTLLEMVFLLQGAAAVAMFAQNYGYTLDIQSRRGLRAMKANVLVVWAVILWSRVLRFAWVFSVILREIVEDGNLALSAVGAAVVLAMSYVNYIFFADATKKIEENLRRVAVDYHNEARKLEKSRHGDAMKVSDLARQAYGTYLTEFTEGEHIYNVRYAYGELLYKLKDYVGAFEQYMAVVAIDPNGKHSLFCAESAIFAAEEQVKKEWAQIDVLLQRALRRDEADLRAAIGARFGASRRAAVVVEVAGQHALLGIAVSPQDRIADGRPSGDVSIDAILVTSADVSILEAVCQSRSPYWACSRERSVS